MSYLNIWILRPDYYFFFVQLSLGKLNKVDQLRGKSKEFKEKLETGKYIYIPMLMIKFSAI